MRIVEDGPRRNAKLVVASVTVVLEAIGDCRSGFFAAWAGDTLAPTEGLDIAAAGFIVAEGFD